MDREASLTEKFIEKAKAIHGDKYDYLLTSYKASSQKVQIICKKHGIFLQTPYSHLHGNYCPKCAEERRRSGVKK